MDDIRAVELGGREEHTTNNRMELMGAIKALEFASTLDTSPITLYTDSEYVMKGITLWIQGWQKRNWKTASKQPVLNQDLWQMLLAETEGKTIDWQYVAGHSGHVFNERCDEIATSFADDTHVALYHGARKEYKLGE